MSFLDYFKAFHKNGLIDDDELEEFQLQYDSVSDELKIELDAEYAAKDVHTEIDVELYRRNYDRLSVFQKISVRFGGLMGFTLALGIITAQGALWFNITGHFSPYIYVASLGGYTLGKKYLKDKYINRLKNNSDFEYYNKADET